MLSLAALFPAAGTADGRTASQCEDCRPLAPLHSVSVPGPVVINEILYRRAAAGQPEFIELFNRAVEPADLGGWTLETETGTAVIPAGTSIEGGGYLVLADTPAYADTHAHSVYMADFPGLSNNGSRVVLRAPEGQIADSLAYSPQWGDPAAGVSLERIDPGALSFDPANWASSLANEGSTPGALNSRFRVDREAPRILFANLIEPDRVEVTFHKFVDLDTPGIQSRFWLNDVESTILEYDPLAGNRVLLDASRAAPGREIVLRTEGVRDFKGNTGGGTRPVAQPIAPGSVVINEILYHPMSAGGSSQSEYLELYNRTQHAVSLEGISLHDEPGADGGRSAMEPVTTRHAWIPAGGYALLYPEAEPVTLSESRTGRFFGLDSEADRFGIRVGRSTLGLVTDGRTVCLADSTGAEIDVVRYSPDWHNPNVMTTRGRSLERIDPAVNGDDTENWGTSTAMLGGTPMEANTLFRPDAAMHAGSRVTLAPNPFSPHGSPEESELRIEYVLDDPNSLLKVSIYDRYGRTVRRLADSYQAGSQGVLVWDGRDDHGRIARIGIYIIYVEAFNGHTGHRQVFRETAVLARRF